MPDAPHQPTPGERRAWRLALLLTGDAARADCVVIRVLQAQPDLEAVPPLRRDRLVVLRSREESQGEGGGESLGFLERARAAHLRRRGVEIQPEERVVFAGLANAMLQLSLRLPLQQHEALMLHRVEGLELRDTARAMDCSTTAAARHIEEAERSIAEAMERDYTDAAALLRRQAHDAQPGEALVRVRAAFERRRRARTIVLAVGTLVLLGACAAVAWLLWPKGQAP